MQAGVVIPQFVLLFIPVEVKELLKRMVPAGALHIYNAICHPPDRPRNILLTKALTCSNMSFIYLSIGT